MGGNPWLLPGQAPKRHWHLPKAKCTALQLQQLQLQWGPLAARCGVYGAAPKQTVATTTKSMKGRTIRKLTIAKKKPRCGTRANVDFPALPREVWAHIMQIRATKMWFERKVAPKIKGVWYYTVEQCSSSQAGQLLEACTLSTMIHKNRKVAYRAPQAVPQQFGPPVGVAMGLHVERTWHETVFQTRFQTSCSMHLMDNANTAACLHHNHPGINGWPPMPTGKAAGGSGPTVHRAVRVDLGIAVGCFSFPKATVPRPKKLGPTITC